MALLSFNTVFKAMGMDDRGLKNSFLSLTLTALKNDTTLLTLPPVEVPKNMCCIVHS